jgi:subtilisin family serine protease
VSRSRIRSACSAALPLLLAIASLAAPNAAARDTHHNDRPRRGSVEYRLSWGVEASRASRAYSKGATGNGVVVAMIDTGLDAASARLFRNLATASTDLVPTRREDDGDHGHGGQTASLLAARLDGAGTFGIAYDATLLSISADRDGSCRKVCAFDREVLGRAIDYAVDHGAQVIGLPFASKRPIPEMELSFARRSCWSALAARPKKRSLAVADTIAAFQTLIHFPRKTNQVSRRLAQLSHSGYRTSRRLHDG